MLEPLPTAERLEEISPGIFRWAAFSPFHRVELTSHAVLADGGLLVFDPIPLAAESQARLHAFAGPRALVLTNGNHLRASQAWSAQLGARVWSQAPEFFPADLKIVHWCLIHSPPFASWVAHPLPGGAPGETAFLHAGLSLAVFGDAVVNLPGRTLELLPDQYCTDPRQLRRSLKGLPPFERALFAHGQPLHTGASDRIAALL
jgi:glyoxylase-like metal-dependent hydrolase (beta-lactamase superfamily II)